MDTAINNLQNKSFIDRFVDWASENPLTALLATAAIGSIGYSIYNNRTIPERTSFRKKRKAKAHDSKSMEIQKETTIAEAVKSFFQEKVNEKESKLNIPNTIAAVTTVAATTAVAATNAIPKTASIIAGGVIAGIGLLTQTPIAMIAGVGLLAGSVLKSMLSKTTKSEPIEGIGSVEKDKSVQSVNTSLPSSKSKEEGLENTNDESSIDEWDIQTDLYGIKNQNLILDEDDYDFDKM